MLFHALLGKIFVSRLKILSTIKLIASCEISEIGLSGITTWKRKVIFVGEDRYKLALALLSVPLQGKVLMDICIYCMPNHL